MLTVPDEYFIIKSTKQHSGTQRMVVDRQVGSEAITPTVVVLEICAFVVLTFEALLKAKLMVK